LRCKVDCGAKKKAERNAADPAKTGHLWRLYSSPHNVGSVRGDRDVARALADSTNLKKKVLSLTPQSFPDIDDLLQISMRWVYLCPGKDK